MFSEHGIFLKFRLDPYSFPVIACIHLRRWIESERPDFLEAYYRAIATRLATTEIEALLLLREVDALPAEFRCTNTAFAVRLANEAVLRGENIGLLN